LTQKQAAFKDIMVQSELAPNIPDLMFDKGQIEQALINLILNAVEATDEGGTITVVTAHDTARQAALITISDTGHGIDKEKIDTIFEPFFTTKESGTGLGLSITHGIIEQHGGTISVESKMGRGTSFTIQLPVSEEK
jgi:signal transduction histidine kinase